MTEECSERILLSMNDCGLAALRITIYELKAREMELRRKERNGAPHVLRRRAMDLMLKRRALEAELTLETRRRTK